MRKSRTSEPNVPDGAEVMGGGLADGWMDGWGRAQRDVVITNSSS